MFIDPSYELRDEHRDVIDAVVKAAQALRDGRRRDLVSRHRAALGRALRARVARDRHRAMSRPTSSASRASGRGGGLIGSGMFVVNPPWQLDEELAAALPWLAERLAVDDGASYRAEG